MTEIRVRPTSEDVKDRPEPETDRVVTLPNAPKPRRRYGRAMLDGCALLLLLGGFATGG